MEEKAPRKEGKKGKPREAKNNELKIRYININGNSEDKEDMIWEAFYKDREACNIVCLTETHKNVESRGNLERIMKMRKIGEKREEDLRSEWRKTNK